MTQADVPIVIVECVAPEPVLRERIAQRCREFENVSEADQQVLSRQLETCEPLSARERHYSIEVDTSGSVVMHN